ncbi:MAG: VIT and VWA domain-containing protein [Betaproteobacteria bacterium]|nr:VIT and VWA domain-containing protein [Betaproteobacteria bacterium]
MNLMDYASLSTRDGDELMLKGVKFSGDLRGVLLEMSIEQRFLNPTNKNVEIVYSFPLPWGAVLLDVSVQLGSRHLNGVVVEKKQAEARYEETLSEGDTAIMLEKNHDLSYSLNLGNLAAKESCVITLRYAQTLQFEQHGLRLLIPTVIAPRYGDPVQDGGLQPHQVPEYSLAAEYPFEIELRLHGNLGRARVASPTHPIAVRTTDGVGVTVSLARQGALDRDFVLIIDELLHESVAVVALDSVESSYVALSSFCPRVPLLESTAISVKLLVDCSGSMSGDSIDAARRALQAIVLQLNKGDRFSLSRFGSTVEHRSRALWVATDATRAAAQRWIGDLQANLGGTEMESAMKSTFALPSGPSCDVLLVTDGEISAIDQTIESAKASGHRVFVAGIGSSPAEGHLRRLAEATGGACDFVVPGEAVGSAVLRMFARLRSPRLDCLSIIWPEEKQPEWSTAVPQSVFDGDTVSVYALFRQLPVGKAQLLGMRPGQEAPELIASAEIGSAAEPSATLSRMAAHARVASCRQGAELAEATRLSVAYQLVTDQTNYLLVYQRAEQAADMPELHKVAQMVPAGWGGMGSVRHHAILHNMGTDDMALPATMTCRKPRSTCRKQRRNCAPAAPSPSAGGFGGNDIPAFLRRRGPDDTDFVYPLTPSALAKKLRAAPLTQQPASYAELRGFSVDPCVVYWLELAVAAQDGVAHAEHEWVAAFLFVISHVMHEFWSTSSVQHGLKRILEHLREIFDADDGKVLQGVDRRLVEKIATALSGVSADTWPDQVYAMSAESGG